MSLVALILSWFITGTTIANYGILPLDHDLVEQQPIIQHNGYAPDDERQKMVKYAYKLWWIYFVLMLECESWFNPYAVWDSWRSYGLCQINTRWHKLPDEYKTSWQTQVEYCYQKRKWWTKFHWPQRRIHWVKCSTYVKNRFIISK